MSSRSRRQRVVAPLLGAIVLAAVLSGAKVPRASAQEAFAPACVDTNGNGNKDDDGDGLCDNWEATGIPTSAGTTVPLYDVNKNGTVEPAEQAMPQHKDLYVELDSMPGFAPTQASLDAVVAAFDRAPVDNPDGTQGIRLHFQVDGEIPFAHRLFFDSPRTPCQAPPRTGIVSYCALRAANFGTAAERSGAPATVEAKSYFSRYAIFGDRLAGASAEADTQDDQVTGSGTAGVAFQPGDDFAITVGAFKPRDTVSLLGGTVMHEFGHDLGIKHGGVDEVNCKPNHISVMNYAFEIDNVPSPRRPLDFSRQALPDLNKSALDERVGVQGAEEVKDVSVPFGPTDTNNELRSGPARGPIDWNGNGAIDPSPVNVDINSNSRVGDACPGGGDNVLKGATDWPTLQYVTEKAKPLFAATVQAAGPAPLGSTHRELGHATLAAMSPDTDHDGVKNIDDDCVYVANPSQTDTDQDGLGDACEGDAPPTVDAGPDQKGPANGTLTLTGTVSNDASAADNLVTAWSYTPALGTPSSARCAIADTKRLSTTLTCSDPGNYLVTLTATDSINPAVSDSATVQVTDRVIRLAGPDRIATAAATSMASFPEAASGQSVVLARADAFPDALAGAPLAVAKSAPLLLTNSSQLSPAARAEIQRVLAVGKTVYVLGGNSAVSASVDSELTGLGYVVTRFAGADRYETATRIADGVGPPAAVLLTTGADFADALSAGPAASVANGVVLLTAGRTLPAATRSYLAAHPAVKRYAIGGAAAAADPVATAVAGSDRYDTSRRVAEQFFTSPFAKVGVASGASFADGLAGGAHAGRLQVPLLLTAPTALPAVISDYLQFRRTALDTAYLYGGGSAVAEPVRDAIAAAIT